MTRSKTISMCVEIDNFLRRQPFPRAYLGLLRRDDGTPVDPDEAAALLTIAKTKGHQVYPLSRTCGNPCPSQHLGCSGFDYAGGGCPGRYEDAT